MAKLYAIAIFCLALGFVCFAGPQITYAQNKPIPEVKENANECDDDKDLTEADRASIKVSLAEARKIALERVPGKVADQELEKENGRLQYAFDIRTVEGKTFDVEIDAITGEILQAEEEDDEDADDGAKTKSISKIMKIGKTAELTKIKPQL